MNHAANERLEHRIDVLSEKVEMHAKEIGSNAKEIQLHSKEISCNAKELQLHSKEIEILRMFRHEASNHIQNHFGKLNIMQEQQEIIREEFKNGRDELREGLDKLIKIAAETKGAFKATMYILGGVFAGGLALIKMYFDYFRR